MKTWFTIDGTLEPISYPGPSHFRFPAALAELVLTRYSSAGDWVFDPYCGFGTTLVVAQRLGRQAIGFEKDVDRARFAAARVTPPTRVIQDSIFQLSHYSLPRFPVLLTGIPYSSLREWNGEGFVHYLEDVRSAFTSIKTVMQPAASLIVEVCNVREEHRVRPVAWDVGQVLAELFHFEGESVRCNTGPEQAGPGFDHSYLLVFTNRNETVR